MLSDRIKAVLLMLGVVAVTVAFLAGLAFAAIIAGWLGVLVFGVYVGLMYWSVSEWYTARVLRRRQRRLRGAPSPDTP